MSKKTSKKKTLARNSETITFSSKFYASEELDNSKELMKKIKTFQVRIYI